MIMEGSMIQVQDRDCYYLTRLWKCFNNIARSFGGDDVDELTFTRWVQSSRVITYFKRLEVPVSLYDRAKALNESNKKFISSLLILYLTEVLGKDRCGDIEIDFNVVGKTSMYDFIFTVFLNPGDTVNYTLEYGNEKLVNGAQVDHLYIKDRKAA